MQEHELVYVSPSRMHVGSNVYALRMCSCVNIQVHVQQRSPCLGPCMSLSHSFLQTFLSYNRKYSYVFFSCSHAQEGACVHIVRNVARKKTGFGLKHVYINAQKPIFERAKTLTCRECVRCVMLCVCESVFVCVCLCVCVCVCVCSCVCVHMDPWSTPFMAAFAIVRSHYSMRHLFPFLGSRRSIEHVMARCGGLEVPSFHARAKFATIKIDISTRVSHSPWFLCLWLQYDVLVQEKFAIT